MKNCFFVIARFVLIFLPLSLFGQQIKHLGVYDGFLSGAVRTFEKDTLGYMWIGTSQGLNRYSGSKFKNYNQFLNNGVVDIISKDENLLVLSSTEGIPIFEGMILRAENQAQEDALGLLIQYYNMPI